MKTLLLLLFVFAFAPFTSAQEEKKQIRWRPSLPLKCSTDDRVYKYTGGQPEPGLYVCTGDDLWDNDGDGKIPMAVSPGSLRFNSDFYQHVNHGQFWIPGEAYSHFFTEVWVKPTKPNSQGYIISAGYGGQHEELLGVITDASKAYITANFFGNGAVQDFTYNGEGFPLGEWSHLAWGWDGSHVMTWVNGALSSVKPYSGTRQTDRQASNGILFVGGSDHLNFDGNIAQVRKYEGSGSVRELSDFFPERYFRPLKYIGRKFFTPQFLANYMSAGVAYQDWGSGFEGNKHDGVISALSNSTAENVFWSSDAYPDWIEGNIVRPSQPVPVTDAPAGALVFDSFSRVDSTYAFTAAGDNVTGATEGGSLGSLPWSVTGWPIRDGRLAYWHNFNTINTVDAGVADANVCVDRINNGFVSTGLVLRYASTNDYLRIEAGPDSIRTAVTVAGISTNHDNTGLSTNWTRLCGKVKGNNLEVSRDGNVVRNLTVPSSSATRHGLYGNNSIKSVARYDNFTITAPPSNDTLDRREKVKRGGMSRERN